MPEGFSPSWKPPMLPPLEGVGAFNILYITGDVEGEKVSESIAVLEVQPPEELRLDGASWHFPALWGFTTSDRSAARYDSWCFGDIMSTGDVEMSSVELPIGTIGSGGRYGWEGHCIARLRGGRGPQQRSAGLSKGRLFALNDSDVHHIGSVAFRCA